MANQHSAWTDKENKILKQFYNKISIDELFEKLPGRTKKSIQSQANRLGVTTQKWTEDEVEFLKNNFMKKSYKRIAEKLNKTESAVQQKVRLLKLKKAKPSVWSKTELTFLKENFNSLTYDEIQKNLNRTLPSIYNKAYELGLSSNDDKYRKLKFNQRQYILNNCHKMTDQQLADMFGVSTDAIADLRKKNGIKKEPNKGSKKMTKPEKIVHDYLTELGVEFEYNIPIGGYYPDFTIKGEKLIEIQGDYFHCNPRLYPNGPNEQQIDYIIKDYYKKCFYMGNNIPVLYLWEHDIENDWNAVKTEILNYCRSFEKSDELLVGKFGER